MNFKPNNQPTNPMALNRFVYAKKTPKQYKNLRKYDVRTHHVQAANWKENIAWFYVESTIKPSTQAIMIPMSNQKFLIDLFFTLLMSTWMLYFIAFGLEGSLY